MRCKGKRVRGITEISYAFACLNAGDVAGKLNIDTFNCRFVFLPSGQFRLPNLMPLHILLGSPGTRCPDTV